MAANRPFSVFSLLVTTLTAGATIALGGCARPEDGGGLLTIKGSDTMLHLVNTWAEEFMGSHEGAEVSVNGGGSGTGIAALINGTTDICMSSRDINEEERQLAEQQGSALEEIVVAQDGIAIAVHKENQISSLTNEQLEKIFTGAYTNWNKVGGPDLPIIVLSRESNSGTYVFFQEHVLNKKNFTTSARLLPATNAIVQALTTDTSAIGYIGLGYAEEAGESVKVLSIAPTVDAEPIAPTEETVKAGKYPIARALHFYVPASRGELAQAFVNYCLSPQGQEIVRETGYVTVN